jgi:hypothetical protein
VNAQARIIAWLIEQIGFSPTSRPRLGGVAPDEPATAPLEDGEPPSGWTKARRSTPRREWRLLLPSGVRRTRVDSPPAPPKGLAEEDIASIADWLCGEIRTWFEAREARTGRPGWLSRRSRFRLS